MAAGQPWGVAVPGPFDYEHGIGLFAGVAKFEALYGVDVGAALAAGLPGPPGPIVFLNDADAFLWGEWLFGVAAGHDRCVAITLGTGIGSAFVADGRLRHCGPGCPARRSGRPVADRRACLLKKWCPLEPSNGLTSNAQGSPRAAPNSSPAGPAPETKRPPTSCEHPSNNWGRPCALGWKSSGLASLVVGGSMTGSWDLIGPALLRGLQSDGATSLTGLVATVAARPEHAALLGAAAYAARGEGR